MERKFMITFFVVATLACIGMAAFSTNVAVAFVYVLLAVLSVLCGFFVYFGKSLM